MAYPAHLYSAARMKVVVIIPAAGLGTRMSAVSGGPKSKSKQFFELQGRAILVHTLRKFAACDAVSEIVVALRKNEAASFQNQSRTRNSASRFASSKAANTGKIPLPMLSRLLRPLMTTSCWCTTRCGPSSIRNDRQCD